jgi:hypothetical protein
MIQKTIQTCHRDLIFNCVNGINQIEIWVAILTTRCQELKSHFSIPAIQLFILTSMLEKQLP